MKGRVDLTARKGVNAFENIIINEIGWIFREQTVLDYGIDAIIEEVIYSDGHSKPTGKLIGVQIKTGISNVKVNKDGDFVYYMSRVHYEYWLSHVNPVIFVLFDPDTQKTYWSPIVKRTIEKTKQGEYKLIIRRDSILSKESKRDLTELLKLSHNYSLFDENIILLNDEELLDFSHSLLSQSSSSLKSITDAINTLDGKIKIMNKQNEIVLVKAKGGQIDNNIILKELRKSTQYYKLALNIATTNIKKEMPIVVDTHIKAIRFMFHLLNKYNNSSHTELQDILTLIVDEFSREITTIDSLRITMGDAVTLFRKNDKYSDSQLRAAKNIFALTIENYSYELKDLRELLSESLIKYSQLKTQT